MTIALSLLGPAIMLLGVVLAMRSIVRDRTEQRLRTEAFRAACSHIGAAKPRCFHPEVVDVTSPVFPGEILARLCTNPECSEQLPADYKAPVTMEDYHRALEALPGPLLVSSSPPSHPRAGQVHHEIKDLRREVKVWNGDYWEAVSRGEEVRKSILHLDDRTKSLIERLEQLVNEGVLGSAEQTHRPM